MSLAGQELKAEDHFFCRSGSLHTRCQAGGVHRRAPKSAVGKILRHELKELDRRKREGQGYGAEGLRSTVLSGCPGMREGAGSAELAREDLGGEDADEGCCRGSEVFEEAHFHQAANGIRAKMPAS